MGNASTSVASGHCRGGSVTYPSIRPVLTAGVTVASVGILVVSLVAAPPHVNGARTDVRPVQLAAVAWPQTAAALLEKFISNQSRTVLPIKSVVNNDPTDPATAVGTSPLTFVRVVQPTAAPTLLRVAAGSTAGPAIQGEQANEVPLPATTAATADLSQILYAIFIAPFVLVFFGIAIVISAIQSFFYNLANPAVPTALDGTILSEPAAITTALAEPADAASATESWKADVSPPATSTDTLTHTDQITPTGPATEKEISTGTATSQTDVTETAQSDVPEASTEPTAAETPKPSAKTSTSAEPTSVTVRPATPRPVLRGSLGVGEQLRNPPHRGNGGHPTTQTAAADEREVTEGPSPVTPSHGASSSKVSNSSGGDSSGGDAGGS
jgi:hypothetical protein